MSEFDDSVFTPEIIEENDLDTDVLGDGINAADDSDGSSTNDLNPVDTLASPVLLSTPLTAAPTENQTWVVTTVEDYLSSEDPIEGSFRYILSQAANGDTIMFSDSCYDSDGRAVIRLKRSFGTQIYNVIVRGALDGDPKRKVVFTPYSSESSQRFASTLGTSATANAEFYYCDWTGYNYDGESSTVRSALFAYYDGLIVFGSCGFYNNPSVGTRGAILLINRTSTSPAVIFSSCIGYNNNLATISLESGAICANLNQNGVVQIYGCTFGNNQLRDVNTVTDIDDEFYFDNLIRTIRVNTVTRSTFYEDDVFDYDNNDFRLLKSSEYATAGTVARMGYDRVSIPVGGPVGALGRLYVPRVSYLTKVFGDDETILKALTGLDVPFLGKIEADNYFGDVEEH